jgi:hypothetical protein
MGKGRIPGVGTGATYFSHPLDIAGARNIILSCINMMRLYNTANSTIFFLKYSNFIC